MKQLKKTLLTLVALLAVTTGAWATDVITVTWSSGDTYENNNSKDGVTLTGDIVRYRGDEWQLAYDEEKGTFTTELGNFTKIEITGGYIDGFSGEGWSSGRTWTGNAAAVPFGGYITDDSGDQPWTITFTIEPASSASASGPEVAWDKAKNSGSFTMPGGNVTLEPEYYPQAALTAKPTAINDVPATTDGAIVNAGTVANIGETANAQGTVMYYVSQTEKTDAALLALAATDWTADVPTAENLAEGQAYVYYYVRGNDGDTDETTFSDGDIVALTVTIAAAPTYAVTFADDLAEPDKWTADPATGVTKGTEVTVTYTGSKKVIGVKAEKKAKAPAETTVTLTTGEIGNLPFGQQKTIGDITIALSGNAYFHATAMMDVTGDAGPEPDPEQVYAVGSFTFTSSVGKIKRIDINHGDGKWLGAGDGWPGSYEVYDDNSTFTWSGTPAASVTLNGSHKGFDFCYLNNITSIVFTIEPTN